MTAILRTLNTLYALTVVAAIALADTPESQESK